MTALLASDILGKSVWDQTGTELGIVHDIRAELRGHLGERGAIRVTGIVVGTGSVGIRLGYGDAAQRGPWLLSAIFTKRAERARYVSWSDLRVEPDRIVVTGDLQRLADNTEAPS
jgi:sporulation protein YlmC with PRC-barrel domain